jgi:hypothetical protein
MGGIQSRPPYPRIHNSASAMEQLGDLTSFATSPMAICIYAAAAYFLFFRKKKA